MSNSSESSVEWQGRFIRVACRGGWEYVSRRRSRGVVAIVAITGDRRVILVEQHRPPLGGAVIELPAGLAGDIAGLEHEPLVDAARRELLEETGYEADDWRPLCDGASSAGLTDEVVTVFLAMGARRAGPGGGDESESIIVHEVPLDHLTDWLAAQREAGRMVDIRVHLARLCVTAAAP